MTGVPHAAAARTEAYTGHSVVVVRSWYTRVLAEDPFRHWACSPEACGPAVFPAGLAGEAGGRLRALRANRPH